MAGTRPTGSEQGGEGLIVAGMLLGILVPPIGLAIGVYVLSRGDSRGWWPTGLAVGIMLLGAIMLLRYA